MESQILELLKSINEDADFENSSDFVEDGFLDSFEIVSLVDALEESFEVEISGKDIVPENFVSLATIVALVERS